MIPIKPVSLVIRSQYQNYLKVFIIMLFEELFDINPTSRLN